MSISGQQRGTPKLAVAFDATSTLNGTTAALTHSWGHTCTGTNRLLVVGVSVFAGDTVSTVTYAGVTLTKAGHIASVGNDRAEMWYLIAPATGANTIVVTLSASARAVLGATSWTAVYQITPVGTFATGTGTSTTALATAVSETSGYVADTLATPNAPTVGAGQSERWNAGHAGFGGGVTDYGAGSTEVGAASVAMTWTLAASTTWAAAALPIKTSTGYGTGTALITGGGVLTATGGGPDYDFQVGIAF